jgi:hypothetical protein
MNMLRYYAKNRWEYFLSLPSDSVFLMLLCLSSGTVQLSNLPLSAVVDDLVGPLLEFVWALTLVAGSALTIWGLLKRPPGGFDIEAGGRWMLGGSSLVRYRTYISGTLCHCVWD